MRNVEKVAAELKNRALDQGHEKALRELWRQILEAFESKGSEEVSKILAVKMESLHSAYNQDYWALIEKMGLKRSGL